MVDEPTREYVHTLERKIDVLGEKFDGMKDLLDERWKAVTKSIEENARHQETTVKLLMDKLDSLDGSYETLKGELAIAISDQRVLKREVDDLEAKVDDMHGNQRWLGRTVIASLIAAISYALSGFPHPH